MRTRPPGVSTQEDAQEVVKMFYKSRMAAEFFKQNVQGQIESMQREQCYPNLRKEEKLLIKEYQKYLGTVKVQQDKIMKTQSYPPTKIEVPAQKIEDSTVQTRDFEILARNRNLDEQNDVEEPTYTIKMPPKLISQGQLGTYLDVEDKTYFQQLSEDIFKIRQSPLLGSQVIRYFVDRNTELAYIQSLPETDSKFLLNFSNLFYGDLYLEDKMALSPNEDFLRAFIHYMAKEKFKADQFNRVVFANSHALKVAKIVFEGYTRKLPANNFLRHIYESNFAKVYISQIQEQIIRQILMEVKNTNEERQNALSKLSDKTEVGGISWGSLKQNAMRSDYRKQSWFGNLSNQEKHLVETLREYQNSQGNMSELRSKTSNEEQKSEDKKKKGLGRKLLNLFSDQKQEETKTAGQTREEKQYKGLPMNVNEVAMTLEEKERIQNLLSGGQFGEQTKLSNIFVGEERKESRLFGEDALYTIKSLKNEIEDETENKNCLLKDQIVSPQCQTEDLQINFSTANFYAGSSRGASLTALADSSPVPKRDETKDLTANCIKLVDTIMRSLMISTDKIPYDIRAMLRVIVLASKTEKLQGISISKRFQNNKVKLETREIYLIADILVGCWLNTGFRNSSCFGVLQPLDREKSFTHMLFQSCRVIFEHLFSLQLLPFSQKTDFDIARINQYIRHHQDLIFLFYTRIIDVNLPNLDTGRVASPMRRPTTEEEINPKDCLEYKVQSSILRFSDLQTLSQVIDHIPINERGFNLAINNLKKFERKKFDDLQELFVLFTQFKAKDLSAIPSEQDMEKNALKKVGIFATQHFYHEEESKQGLGLSQQMEVSENKNWSHGVKGTDPKKILTALYTNLMYLIKEFCFVDTRKPSVSRSLDEVFQYILDHELSKADSNKRVLMVCRLSLKLLKSLKILPDLDTKPTERSQMLSLQNKILDSFLDIYKSCTSEYLKCYQNRQSIEYHQFSLDLERFKVRRDGLKASFERIAQHIIQKISAQEMKFCVFQNLHDYDHRYQGIFLTLDCLIHTGAPPLQAVFAFELFDSPKIMAKKNASQIQLNNKWTKQQHLQHHMKPLNNKMIPFKKQRRLILEETYKDYLETARNAIIKQSAWGKNYQNHKEINYLESMLLFLTQECKVALKQIIKCEYLLENNFIEQVNKQKEMLSLARDIDSRLYSYKQSKTGISKYVPDTTSRDKHGNLMQNQKNFTHRKMEPELIFSEAAHDALMKFNFKDFPVSIHERPCDYLHFVETYKYFLDFLLVEFSQVSETVTNYQDLIDHDANTERLRHCCTEYFMRRIHNTLVGIKQTEFDQAAMNVLRKRYEAMTRKVPDPEGKREPRAKYSSKQLDESLYQVSIQMLSNLSKEETPSTKRKLINEAFELAMDALSTVKSTDAEDEDFLFSYLFYLDHRENKQGKQKECRLFSQLHFTLLFDIETDKLDNCKRFFEGLYDKIVFYQTEDALKVLEEASYSF